MSFTAENKIILDIVTEDKMISFNIHGMQYKNLSLNFPDREKGINLQYIAKVAEVNNIASRIDPPEISYFRSKKNIATTIDIFNSAIALSIIPLYKT